MEVPYELLGRFFVFLAVAVLLATVLALLLGVYSFKRHKIVFSNFIQFVLYIFYSPAKWVCRVFYIKEELVDEILIELKNAMMLEKFARMRGGRIILLPQCMRGPKCATRCDPIIGYECKMCGKCDVGRIAKAAEKYNFKVFVVPGGSFVRKILKSCSPDACIAVACYSELTEAMQDIAKVAPVQGVPLLRDGCYDTKVDVDEVIKKMELCCDV